MRFAFTEEQEQFRSILRRFLEDKSPATEVRRLMETGEGCDRGVAGSLAIVTRTIGVVSGATGLALAFAGFTPSEEVTGPSAFLIPFTATFTAAGASLLAFLGLTFVRPGTWRGPTTRCDR